MYDEIAQAQRLAIQIYNSSACKPDLVDVPNLEQQGMLTKRDLKVGGIYVGYCRNASEGVWTGSHFEIIRVKFDYRIKDFEHHPEDDRGFDVFVPTLLIE